MLKYFFEIGNDQAIFEGLEISKDKELCDQYQGKFPVISVSLKGAKAGNYEDAKAMMKYFMTDNQVIHEEEKLQAVAAFQTYAGREATGTVDRETWDEIYAQYQGIRVTVFGDGELFPFSQFPGEAAVPAFARQNGNAARSRYQDSTRFVQYPGMVLSNGMRDQEVDG